MILIYFLIVLIAIYAIVSYWRTRKYRQLMKDAATDIPSLPFVGIAYHLLGSNETRMQALQYFGREATKAGGVAAGWLGPYPYVVITDPVEAEVVLKECLDKHDVMNLLQKVIGHGLIVAPLSVWHKRRKVLAPTFISKNLKQFVKIFVKQSQIMVEQLEKHVGKGPFPVWRYLAANNLDVVCEAVFGARLNVQQNPEHPFFEHFNEASSIMATRCCQPWIHSDMIFKLLPRYQNFKRTRDYLYSVVDDIIQQKHKDIENSKNENRKEGMRSFLELLMESSALEDGPYNDQELREETLTLTIAGSDTSAAGAAFVLLALSRNQDVQEKVYQEIKDVLGNSAADCTMEDLQKLTYTDITIKESLRLYTPVPVALRKIINDVTLPSGLTLPAGCGVLVNIWAMHRNQKYWGEDAEEFRPERFLDTPFKHPAQFMAFSFGPRNCPGSRYSILNTKAALAILLMKYRLLPVAEEPRYTFELMMKDADDFRIQLELRN